MLPINIFLRCSAVCIGISIAISTNALACSCRGPATCETYKSHGTTFVADVLSSGIVSKGQQIGAYKAEQDGTLFRVRVVEQLSGLAVGQEVFVMTGLGGGDCAYPFEVGHRYLIDAHTKDGVYSTSICTLTGPATPDNTVLRELRLNASRKRIPDVTGAVVQSGPPLKWGNQRPLQDATVLLQRAGQPTQRAVTDENGIYAFDYVAAGVYHVVVEDIPPNLAVSGSNLKPYLTDEIGELLVPEHTNQSSACHLSISAGPAGTIMGKVSGPKKLLSDGYVSAYQITKNGRKGEDMCSRSPEESGEFRLTYLPAGKYLVIFESGSKFKGPIFEVDLRDGEQKSIGEMKLK